MALVVVGLLLSGLLDSGALQDAGQSWPLAAGLVDDLQAAIRAAESSGNNELAAVLQRS